MGKTLTVASRGDGLAREGKKTLVINADSRFSLTVSFGVKEPEKLPVTLTAVMNSIINEREFKPTDGVIRHFYCLFHVNVHNYFPFSNINIVLLFTILAFLANLNENGSSL